MKKRPTKGETMRREWKKEDIAQLKELHAKGLSYEAISELTNRSPSSIVHKCSRLNLKRHDGKAFIRKVAGKEYWAICKKRKAVFIHRVLAEKIKGRNLRSNEIVHHINRNSLDNRRSNLQVMTIS